MDGSFRGICENVCKSCTMSAYTQVQSICLQNIEREKYFKVTLVPVESFSPVSYALIKERQ